MKCFPAITAALLLGCSSIAANAQSTEQLLGAIAGGALGSTIGDGDGQKAATVIGAIIGYRMGERLLNPTDKANFVQLKPNDLRQYCRSEVPSKYEHYYNLKSKWIAGCVQRLQRQQRELEREAYMDGLNNGSTNQY
jgi:uncharacterized protein YcfJ